MKVDGKTSIQHIYNSSKELEEMFLQGLKVPKPNLQMHIATLRALAKDNASVTKIVNAMADISELKRPEGELKRNLQTLNIFPVRQRNGTKSRTSLSVEFAVIDKTIYRGRFDDFIRVLDFDDHQFWRVRDFLIACGLRSQFMSECVTAITAASNSMPFAEKTQDMRSKAYAFLRYDRIPDTLCGYRFSDMLTDTLSIFAVPGRVIPIRISINRLKKSMS